MITDFEWIFDAPVVTWRYNSGQILKRYNYPIRSAVLLRDFSGAAVAEPYEEKGINNAVIFNADGSERFRLEFPIDDPRSICFDQIYYINDELTAICVTRSADFAYVVDPTDGKYLRHYETR